MGRLAGLGRAAATCRNTVVFWAERGRAGSWEVGHQDGQHCLIHLFVQVSPELFCELWIRDTKYVQQPCVALTVYVAMCHKFYVCIEWRGSDYCREWGSGHLLLQLSSQSLLTSMLP